MKRPGLGPVAALGLLPLVALAASWLSTAQSTSATDVGSEQTAVVRRGELIVRTPFDGRLDSRNTVVVAARGSGASTILELAPEGAGVVPGDLLVRFDTTEAEDELLRQQTELTLRSAEFETLRRATHPLQLEELRASLAEVERNLVFERQYLTDSRELAVDALLSPAEVAQQAAKVESLERRALSVQRELQTTETYLQPLEIERAGSRLRAAREQHRRALRKVESGSILATKEGVVAYRALHLDGEYRTARVGDRLFANQPFLEILDLEDLVVRIAVPEAELGSVSVGDPVLLQPTALPEIRVMGTVEQVSELAQTLPDRPRTERFFRARIGVDQSHPQLRPGLRLLAQVLSHHDRDALLVPRRAVRFEGQEAWVRVRSRGRSRDVPVELGALGETDCEVLVGLEAGDVVELR